MSAPQPFEHDGFNSPNEVEVAKRKAAQHTPGPWDRGRASGCTQIYGADGTLVAHVEPHAGNSRLIAAAPDLLAALQGLCIEYELPDSESPRRKLWLAANAAIAKATGSAS